MSAAMEAYDRLMAARRAVTPQEQEDRDKDFKLQTKRAAIRRKLPKVY